jgi:hypothetical protein
VQRLHKLSQLSNLHYRNFQQRDVTTVEDWSSVLKLATQWDFASIRELAIEELSLIPSPVDQLILAHAYDVQRWLMPAYSALCERKEPLSKEEGRRIGVDDVVLIHQVRECMRELLPTRSGLAFITSALEEQLSGDGGVNEVEGIMAPNISEVSQDYSLRRFTNVYNPLLLLERRQ